MSVCVPRVCLAPEGDRRGHLIYWNWGFRCSELLFGHWKQTWDLGKSNTYSELLSHRSRPHHRLLIDASDSLSPDTRAGFGLCVL